MELQTIPAGAEWSAWKEPRQQLVHWLKSGRRDLYQQAMALHQQAPADPEAAEVLRQDWNQLLHQVQALPEELHAFLNQVQTAEAHAAAQQWTEAQEAFRQALRLHRRDCALSHKQLTERMLSCEKALEMRRLIDKGNEAFVAKDWTQALGYFRQVQQMHQPHLGVDAAELKQVIEHCARGQQFELLVHQARNSVKIGSLPDALKIYRKARQQAHPAFEPAEEVLAEEMRQAEAEMADSEASREAKPFWRKPLVSLGLILLLFGSLGFMALAPGYEASAPLAQRTADRSELPEEPTTILRPRQPEREPTLVQPEELKTTETAPPPTQEERAPFSSSASPLVERAPSPAPVPEPRSPASEAEAATKSAEATTDLPAVEQLAVAAPPTPASPAPQLASTAEALPEPPPPQAEAKDEVAAAPLAIAETMPSFPGGEAAMARYLSQRLRYPFLARENGIQGTVYLQMVVQPDGSLGSITLARGLGYGCDEEALRVVRDMPRWQPGRQDGRPVPVIYTLPIAFRIE